LIGRDPEQPRPPREARGELEIREVGAPVVPAQPVLLLGEVVVADAGAVQLAQRRLGRAEVAALAVWPGDMEGEALDETADQRRATAEQQRRRNAESVGAGERFALTLEQMARQHAAPPRHLVDPAQHRFDFACRRSEPAALHGRERVALEHDRAPPAAGDFARICRHHRRYSAATARLSPAIQRSRSASARAVSARFFASVFSFPRSRRPSSSLTGWASGGNSPKLTFIGWYE